MKTKTVGIRREKDGTATIDYKTVTESGIRVHVYQANIASVAIAKEIFPALVEKRKAEAEPQAKSVLMKPLLNEFLAYERGSNLAEQTLTSHYYILNKYVMKANGDRFIDDFFDTDHFYSWWQGIANGDVSIRRKKDVSTLIKYLIDFARKRKYISAQLALDDCDVIPRMVSVKKKADPVAVWTEDEAKRFLGAVPRGSRDEMMYLLLLWLGCRKEELLALQGACHENGSIVIRQQIIGVKHDGFGSKGKTMLSDRLKTNNSYRVCPLPGYLEEKLAAFERRFKIGKDDFLFGEGGRWMSKSTFDRKLRAYCAAAGVTRVTEKGFRHFRAKQFKMAAKTTAEQQAASQFLGHTLSVDLDDYGKANDRDVRAFVEAYLKAPGSERTKA